MIDRSITIHAFGSKTELESGDPASGALRLDLIHQGTLDDILRLARQLFGQPEGFAEMSLHLPVEGMKLGEADSQVNLPAGMNFSVELTLNDLRCKPNTYNYSVRAEDAFGVGNMRLFNAGDMGYVFNNNLSSLVSRMLSDRLNAFVSSLTGSVLGDAGHAVLATVLDSAADKDSGAGKRFYIPMRSKAAVNSSPPILVVVLYAVGGALVTVCLVCLNVVRHRAKPVVLRGTLEPISVFRIILEDLLLSICCFVCAGAFLWSNLTAAACVSVGSELKIYGFTLMGTVRDMWDAGLKPLAVLVFVFSGIYPYFKLACMLLFALVLQRPHARILRVIDYIGKFSFLDTFVMFIMVTGLPIQGVADVIILPSFYIFFGATIASVLLGNCTVLLWRRGTTLTKCGEGVPGPHSDDDKVPEGSQGGISNPPYVDDKAQLSSEHPMTTSDNSYSAITVRPEIKKTTIKERWYINIIIFCVMLGCFLPAWFVPCLRYRVGGVAPLITPEYKEFNLYQLSKAVNPFCFVVSLIVLLIAPCGYALSRRWLTFLASWFAVDAFLLACIAGLLQLNQFVQFMLGSNMEDLYTAHATFLWPLMLLLVGSVLQWVLEAVKS
ncbi:unnamed protein product [Phytomonas sp. EM1]|nr:unnamed protein product [Phytomonas sp. EM1]|eukprot:CCW65034.1 unnamed protein product [Phytomonas sp. isolate EM1]